MLLSFARPRTLSSGDGEQGANYWNLTQYMEAACVVKTVDGTRHVVVRDPVPEVLSGSASLLRQVLTSLSFKRPYCFGLMSFEQEDVDVAAFNAGAPEPRRSVAAALALFKAALWPGLPRHACPPLYVTTHTHLGRLELNIAVPRCIFAADGKIKSYNPDPPFRGDTPSQLWVAVQDVLNHHFSWADPGSPERQRLVQHPDWVDKRDAEAARLDVPRPVDLRAALNAEVQSAIQDMAHPTAADVTQILRSRLAPRGWDIVTRTKKSITVGETGAQASERIRLRGYLYHDDFCGILAEQPERLDELRGKRRAALEKAQSRLQEYWDRRAQYNRCRYKNQMWPEPDWTVAQWASETNAAKPHDLPRKHHIQALAQTPEQPGDAHDPEPNGTTLSRPAGSDQDRGHSADCGVAGQDCSAGGPVPIPGNTASGLAAHRDRQPQGASPAADDIHRQFAQLSGDATRLSGALTTCLQNLPALRGRLAGRQLAARLSPSLAHRLTDLAFLMETTVYDRPATPTPNEAGSADVQNPVCASVGVADTALYAASGGPDPGGADCAEPRDHRRRDAGALRASDACDGAANVFGGAPYGDIGAPRPDTRPTRKAADGTSGQPSRDNEDLADAAGTNLAGPVSLAKLLHAARQVAGLRRHSPKGQFERMRGGYRIVLRFVAIELYADRAVVTEGRCVGEGKIYSEDVKICQNAREVLCAALDWTSDDHPPVRALGDILCCAPPRPATALVEDIEWPEEVLEDPDYDELGPSM